MNERIADGYASNLRDIEYGSPIAPRHESHYDIDGNAYAWGKTARLLTESQLLQAQEDTTGSFVAVDICSSLPYYRQMMHGQQNQRCKDETVRIISSFVDEALFERPKPNGNLPCLVDASPDEIRTLRKTLGPKKERSRQLLYTRIYDLRRDPGNLSRIENPDRQEEAIYHHLLEGTHAQTDLQHVYVEPSGKRGDKGNWQYITNVDSGITLEEELKSTLPEDFVDNFLKDTAAYFAKRLKGKLREITYVSLDREPLDELVLGARSCFPERMHGTLFFNSTSNTDRHIRADALHLPFAPNSIAFFTNIEGFPFYFGSSNITEKMSVALQQTDALKPGGKAIFLPWEVQRQNFDTPDNIQKQTQELAEIEAEWKRRGYLIEKTGHTKMELLSNMTDRELVLTDHSPLFTKTDGIITVLTVTKPKIAA